jgi:hypothetical protein
MAADLHAFIVLLPVHCGSNAVSHFGTGVSISSREDILKAMS